MKNAATLSAVIFAMLFSSAATAFADQAAPIPRITITAKRMTAAEKTRDAALERQREAELAARPANAKAVPRNGKVG